MKPIHLFYILLGVIFTLSILFTSCSDNPITSNNGGYTMNDSLIWSKDSLGISINYISNYSVHNFTISLIDTSIHKVKITFDGETNIDSSTGLSQIELYPTWWDFRKFGKIEINKFHSLIVSNVGQVEFHVYINESYDNTYKYVRLKNIKIFRTQ